MLTTKHVRWAGLALIVSGALDLASTIGAGVTAGDQPLTLVATTTSFLVLNSLLLVAVLLMTLGVVGLYARQAEKAGLLGLVALVVAIAGLLLVSGVLWNRIFVLTSLAVGMHEVLEAPPGAMLQLGWGLSNTVFALGLVLMGVSSAVSKALPAWAGWGLAGGTVLFFILGMLGMPGSVASIPVDAGLVAAGYALWSGKGST